MGMGATQQSAPQSKELTGREKRAQLIGEPAPFFHGTLTSQLHAILDRADPSQVSFDDLERSLKEAFENNVAVKVSDANRPQVVLGNTIIRTRTSELIMRLNEQPARQIITGLEAVITRREQQGDYWPEGRLNLGVAYACLGQYENARLWLADAVTRLRSPSTVPHSEQMAA